MEEIVRKGRMLLRFIAVNYWPIVSRACVESRRCELSGKSPPMETETAEKTHCFPRALNYWAIATKLAKFVAHAWKLRRMNIQGNSSNGNRAEKAHFSEIKCHKLLIDGNHSCTICSACV